MARYMIDGTVVDTGKAQAKWDEATYHDGRNFISKATGSQWIHETLYRSSKGRYYVVTTSAYEGQKASAEFISDTQAAAWLLANDEELPDDLKSAGEEVSE